MQNADSSIRAKSSLSAGGVFVIAVSGGAAVWALSPAFTGHKEPWDGSAGYYLGGLVLASLLASIVSPRHFKWSAPGLFLGQLGYGLIFLEVGPLIILGAVLMCIASGIGTIGGFVVQRVATWRTRKLQPAEPSGHGP